MKDDEGFLSRWSRRKREIRESESEPTKDLHLPEVAPDEQPDLASPDQKAGDAESPEQGQRDAGVANEAEDEFDLSKLPSIESITAETDIRPFLARGVPADLRNAALRRAWVADPHIRDFIGLAENQGDFTGAGAAMPGFDFSPPTGDLARMVANVFGARSPDTPATADQSVEATGSDDREPGKISSSSTDHLNVNPTESVSQANDARRTLEPVHQQSVRRTLPEDARTTGGDAASQENDAPQKEKVILARRSHGGAMPK